jgi:signal transduction histidine kinase
VLSGKVVNIPDAPSASLLQYPEEARQEGIQSMLSAPLIGKDGPLGIIRAYAVEPARFTAEDEAFLAAIAGQGSIAIENAIAYQAIEALDATKTQFIRTVTHELRSPVSVTQSLLRTLASGYAGQVTEQQQDILNRAARRVDFLQKLIDDLLDLASGKADLKAHEERQPVSLTTAVERVVKRYEVSAQEKNLTLELKNRVKDEPLTVLATSEGLDLAFNNLVSNAVKYTPSGGRATVTLARQSRSPCRDRGYRDRHSGRRHPAFVRRVLPGAKRQRARARGHRPGIDHRQGSDHPLRRASCGSKHRERRNTFHNFPAFTDD